ncbi:hypothetical protein IKF74_00380 [Candidatus Saccharibacteria bacterium]|nr:hypothetical protein [Candidatus Saccharibacteria bacterium]
MNKGVSITSKNVELIYANRICCYDDEETDINIKLTEKEEDELKLKFLFKYSNGQETKIDVSGNAESGITLKLTNFNNPLGIGLKKPTAIARLDEKTIYLLFSIYKNGESNPIMDLSLYLENTNAK